MLVLRLNPPTNYFGLTLKQSHSTISPTMEPKNDRISRQSPSDTRPRTTPKTEISPPDSIDPLAFCPKCGKQAEFLRRVPSGRPQYVCRNFLCNGFLFLLKKPQRSFPLVKGEVEAIKCMFCGGRTVRSGSAIKIRRKCTNCGKNFTLGVTKEHILKLCMDSAKKLKTGFQEEDYQKIFEIILELMSKLEEGYDADRIETIITYIRLLETTGRIPEEVP